MSSQPASNQLKVTVFSHEPPNCAVALLRLAGILRHLERQDRMRFNWCAARDPKFDISKLLESDLFVLHREFADRRYAPQVVAAARELNKPLIFELDDLLTDVPKSNPNHKYCNSIRGDVLGMLREADYVTVTTEPLQKYLEETEPEAKGKIHVLPNYINLDIWDGAKPPAETSSEPFVIGWFGTATHDEDLAIVKPAILQLARKYAGKLVFKFWGYLPKDLQGIKGVELVGGSQPDLKLHAQRVINSRIDLAIAPLLDHPFNHAKSDLKWLEYAICYIPAIFSTISPYTNSVEHGKTGWLVENTTKAWLDAIEKLMSDHQLRSSIALQSYETVRKTRCVNVGAEKWDELYKKFHAQGLRPRIVDAAQKKASPVARASAHLRLYQADGLASKGETNQAAELCHQALGEYVQADAVLARFVSATFGNYRAAIADLKKKTEVDAQLAAAATVNEAGESKIATRLYLNILDSVHKSKNPRLVFETMVAVSRAFRTLDPQRGRSLIELADQLATSLRAEKALQQVADLKAEYAVTAKSPASRKPAKAVHGSKPEKNDQARVSVNTTNAPSAATPVVSVVIPVFNNLSLTRDCLESLRKAKNAVRYEVIVVDNASTDGTADFLNEQECSNAIRVLTNAGNLGFARACNQGAQIARGSLLLFLNNDTKVTDNWLEPLVSEARNGHTGVVGAKLLYADGRVQHAGIEFINGIPDHPYRHAAADAPEVNRRRDLDMVTGACLLIHKQLFLDLAGFDESYLNGVEDIDLCLRARAAGKKVIYQPKSVVYHLEGQSVGRFDHVSENLKLFFNRWKGSFDAQFRFKGLKKPSFVKATESLLRPGNQVNGVEKSHAVKDANQINVTWDGSFLDSGSLSHVNRGITENLLQDTGIALARVYAGTRDAEQVSPSYASLANEVLSQAPSNADVTIRHAWPPNWQRPRTGKLVVIQPWEYGSLPVDWVKASRQVDEFWLPSNYVKDVYLKSGVAETKLQVVPNGIDATIFRPDAAPLKLDTTKRFKFLFVGGTIHRKGPDVLLQAYLQTFTAADDVCLVIKDFGNKGCYAGQTMEQLIERARSTPNAPEILYLTDELSPEALPGLYTACDCLAHTYRGEGFGLPVLEAMACGLPVVVTAGGSTEDFVTDDFGYRIAATRKSIGGQISGMKLVEAGWLLEPDTQALAIELRSIFQNPEPARAKGQAASKHVRHEWTWAHSAKIAAERLRILTGRTAEVATEAAANVSQSAEVSNTDHKANVSKPTTKAALIKLPACALVGHLGSARQLLDRKKPREAWQATLAALEARPFHPEAFLLLAEIAYLVGDGESARVCAEHTRRVAPGFKPARQFLNRRFKTNSRPDWLALPSFITEKGPAPRVTVCLITKNEERFLDQCLTSVRGIAQQIVVVDTGSTDRTVEIAKKHGAEVHSFAWCDDFSAARNAALEYVRGDWALVLDADEELTPDSLEALKSHMVQNAVMAWRLPLQNIGREAEGFSYVPRLFRNAPGLFYVGRVHEQVFSSIEVRRQEWGLESRVGEAKLLHHGYTAEITRDRNKVERNLALLEKAVEELPNEPHLLMNLGLELSRSGRETDALARYREAFQAMTSKPAEQITPELRETLLSQFCTRLLNTKAFEEIVRVLTAPASKNPGLNASLHFILGVAQLELGHHADAATQMRQCLAKRDGKSFAPIHSEIKSAAPFHCLALALAQSGDAAGAEKAFTDGMKETVNREKLLHDYAAFLAQQNRAVEGLHHLHELITSNSRNVSAWRLGAQIALSNPEFLEFARDWTQEASQHFPEDDVIRTYRAEALLLMQDTTGALPLWAQLWANDRKPAALAAAVLCEVLEGNSNHRPQSQSEALAVTRAFLAWYQKLVKFGARDLVLCLNQNVKNLATVLPDASRILEAALMEAGTESVAKA